MTGQPELERVVAGVATVVVVVAEAVVGVAEAVVVEAAEAIDAAVVVELVEIELPPIGNT